MVAATLVQMFTKLVLQLDQAQETLVVQQENLTQITIQIVHLELTVSRIGQVQELIAILVEVLLVLQSLIIVQEVEVLQADIVEAIDLPEVQVLTAQADLQVVVLDQEAAAVAEVLLLDQEVVDNL